MSYNAVVAIHSLEQLFKLHVDKVCLFEGDDFMQALISFFAAFWIFNIQYNPKVFNFLSLVERQIFGSNLTGKQRQDGVHAAATERVHYNS